MQPLYHELGVLAKAVHFKNLSAAALHVGLSQPQLSRIIAKLEDELQVMLLDRSAKRKSAWTPVAFQLAETFEKANRRLEVEITSLAKNQEVAELRIGALEGLAEIALRTAHGCFQEIGIKKVTMDIDDLTELEANFLSGRLDLIFTSKPPGRQKFKHIAELGTQIMEIHRTSKEFGIFSTFEFNRAEKKELDPFAHVLVSNSLAVKKDWLRLFGGTTTIPSEPKKTRAQDGAQVLLIGSDLLTPSFWQKLLRTTPKVS